MDTILDALQEGRLFELPENDKGHALQFLAHIIEAFPQIPTGTDIVGNVMAREGATNTALGAGWACPHARVDFEEDLMCVVGWSPTGIDYGAADGTRVSIIVMYFVPTNQRNHYLREISILAKVLKSSPGIGRIGTIKELDDVRNYLLDLIAAGKETVKPDARARMIRLQAKSAVASQPLGDLSGLVVEPVSIVSGSGFKPVVLTQNAELLALIESAQGAVERLESEGVFQAGAWRLIRRHSITYLGGRMIYDCIAVGQAKKTDGK
ncbi:MAG TPA: PTS sugar transporter subunit IIA [Treponemataceae bacterium]|nr:PTS sugar transporter subunit IIA [Treponemataceae bacterium]